MEPSIRFSSDDKSFLEREITIKHDLPVDIADIDFKTFFDFSVCLKWIVTNAFNVVALQLPDELLPFSHRLVTELRTTVDVELYVLGDTSYGSCCVDEVAALHCQAEAIIHFGHSCLSQTLRLPVLHIFTKRSLDVPDCVSKFNDVCDEKNASIFMFYDVFYSHLAEDLYQHLRDIYTGLIFTSTDLTSDRTDQSCFRLICNRLISKERLERNTEPMLAFYIGAESSTLTNLMMTLNKCSFYSYNPAEKTARKESVNINKHLMRRYYKVEQAKDAMIVGIVVGTLGMERYLACIDRLKLILKLAGKKSYIFSVGKLNIAKLANFMEIDVFVYVACPENSVFDSSEFYKPIVTPYEMELACNVDRVWTGDYATDFTHLQPGGSQYVAMSETLGVRPDISLITGSVRFTGTEDAESDVSTSVIKRDDALTVSKQQHDAGSFLSSRSFKGLEVQLGQSEPSTTVLGLSGIPMEYNHENKTAETK